MTTVLNYNSFKVESRDRKLRRVSSDFVEVEAKASVTAYRDLPTVVHHQLSCAHFIKLSLDIRFRLHSSVYNCGAQ